MVPQLDFAAWTATIAGGAGGRRPILAAGGVLDWETEIVRDATFTLVDSSRRAKVAEAGRYLVRYDFGIEDDSFNVATKTRAAVLATLRVADVEQVWGRSQGYWRNAQACLEGHLSAGAVLQLAAGDEVSVHAARFDSEGASPGSTIRSQLFEGQLALWRLKDAWPLFRARLDADEGASTTSEQDVEWDAVEHEDAGFGLDGGKITFDWEAAGFASADYVFLVAVSLEAESSSTTSAGELEVVVYYDGLFLSEPNPKERARVTSFAEGVGGCTRAVGSWLGIVDATSGTPTIGLDGIRVRYLHRDTTSVTFTPRADKCSVQVVAVPRADLDLVIAREQAGGQAADVDGALGMDTTVVEGSSWDHDPAGDGSEDHLVRTVGYGQWALVFGSAYALPLGGSRSSNRLNHRLEVRRGGASLQYGAGVAHDRGASGCERAGVNAHAVVRLETGDDLELYHDQLSNQTDASQDWAGAVVGPQGRVCGLQAIVLRSFALKPTPAVIGASAPTATRTVQVNPSASGLVVAAPAVVRTLQLRPSPVQLGLVSPAVARLVDLTPGPALLGIVAPAVARLVTLTPTPGSIPLVVPSVARLLTATPSAASIPLVVPAVARVVTVKPSPAQLGASAPAVARLVTLTPGGAPLGVLAPTVARLVTLTPQPVELLVVVPTPSLGAIVLVEVSLELARAAALPTGLLLSAALAAALERAVLAQAFLARAREVGAELPTSAELDHLLLAAAEAPALAPAADELASGSDRLEELRASVNRAAVAYAALLRVASVEADFARVLARVARIE